MTRVPASTDETAYQRYKREWLAKHPDYSDPDAVVDVTESLPIECMIVRVSDSQVMRYDEVKKVLTVPTKKQIPTVFPSKRQARIAKWWHVAQSGVAMSHVLWGIRPLSEAKSYE